MRSFILLVSLTALCLGFAGTALGVRPHPVQAGGAEASDRIRVLQARIEVLTGALEDLERRLEEHRARTPAPADDHEPTEAAVQPPASPTPKVREEEPAPQPGPDEILQRALDHLAAGDAGGARAIFTGLAADEDATFELRVRARLGLAATWEAVESRAEVLDELEALKRDLERDGSHPALLSHVIDLLTRAKAEE